MTTTHVHSPSPLRSRLAELVWVIALLSLAAATAPTAHADALDDTFLAALGSKGIKSGHRRALSLPLMGSAMNLV
jgi:hypothetical protein